MSQPESNPLYRDGRYYDSMNRHMLADIPFYIEEAKGAWGPVLELACGAGRLTIPIAKNGVDITGLDQSPSMLAHARTKAAADGVEIPFVEGDCRSLELNRRFSLIFIGFNSMQHLHDYASLAALFAGVRRHLAPEGRFIFDVFNPSIALLARSGEPRKREREFEDSNGQGVITMDQTLVYDDASQVGQIRWYFSRSGPNAEEKDFRIEDLHLRCFFPQELDLLIRSQGFEIVEKFGNFERKPFGSGDPKQVVVCRNRWEGAILGSGAKWSDIYPKTTNLGRAGFPLTAIKEWRAGEVDAGRPSRLADFYRAHGICFDCRCTGVLVTGFDEESLEYLYSPCSSCGGTGRVAIF